MTQTILQADKREQPNRRAVIGRGGSDRLTRWGRRFRHRFSLEFIKALNQGIWVEIEDGGTVYLALQMIELNSGFFSEELTVTFQLDERPIPLNPEVLWRKLCENKKVILPCQGRRSKPLFFFTCRSRDSIERNLEGLRQLLSDLGLKVLRLNCSQSIDTRGASGTDLSGDLSRSPDAFYY